MDSEARQKLQRLLVLSVGVAALLGLLAAGMNPDTALGTTIAIFRTRFLGIFIEAIPFLMLGTLVSGLIEAFMRREDLVRLIPRNRYLATAVGAFLGFAFPVCECGVVPVTRRLFKKGLPVSVGIAFLLAAPVMNPIVFAATFSAFGFGEVLALRYALTTVIAIGVGIFIAAFYRPQDLLLPTSMAAVTGGASLPTLDERPLPCKQQRSLGEGLRAAVGTAVDEFFDMARYLIIGCLLAAAMQTLIPQQILTGVGSTPVLSVATMQLLAFILSVCSTVDAFLALAFVGTFTTGAIVAFLTFGPMIDIKSTLMFLGVFKRQTVALLILLPLLASFISGVLINLWSGQ